MFKFTSIFVFVFIVLLGGCGGGGGSSNNNTQNNLEKVAIDTTQKAINTIAAMDEMMESMDSLDQDINMINPDNLQGLSLSPNQPTFRAQDFNITKNCLISGTVSLSGSVDITKIPVQFDLISSLAQCQNQANTTLNGTIAAKGSENNMTVVFTDYTRSEPSGVRTLNITTQIEQMTKEQSKIRVNGNVKTPKLSVTFTDYVVTLDESANTTIINGIVSLAHTPTNCADGTYQIETIQPLYEDPISEEITSGAIKINNTLFTFQPDGTVTALINNQPVTIDTDKTKIICN